MFAIINSIVSISRGDWRHFTIAKLFHSNTKPPPELPPPLETHLESGIQQNQSVSNRKKAVKETKAKQATAETPLEAVISEDHKRKLKPEKPSLMVKPTVVKKTTVTENQDDNGESTAASDADGDENQYYNIMARSRKLPKEDLKNYIAAAEGNNELTKQYNVRLIEEFANVFRIISDIQIDYEMHPEFDPTGVKILLSNWIIYYLA